MKFSIDKTDKYSLINLEEENLNSLVAPDLKAQFIFFKNEGVDNLILNLEKVKYIDSSGLSAILTANRLFNAEGSFVLTGVVHDAVEKLIAISRLDSILTIIPTTSESIDYVFMEELERELLAGNEEE